MLNVKGASFHIAKALPPILLIQVVGELWRPAGGAYNVDNVLKVMVRGLEQELRARMDGKKISAMVGKYPSPAIDADFLKAAERKISSANQDTPTNMDDVSPQKIQQQGADISIPFRRIVQFVQSRNKTPNQ